MAEQDPNQGQRRRGNGRASTVSTPQWMHIQNTELLTVPDRIFLNNMRVMSARLDYVIDNLNTVAKVLETEQGYSKGCSRATSATSIEKTAEEGDLISIQMSGPRKRGKSFSNNEGDIAAANAILERDFDMLRDIMESSEYKKDGGKEATLRSKNTLFYTLFYTQILFEMVMEKLEATSDQCEQDEDPELRIKQYEALSPAQQEGIFIALSRKDKQIQPLKTDDSNDAVTGPPKTACN